MPTFYIFRMTADPQNPLVLDVLHASSTAYSYFANEDISEVYKSRLLSFHIIIMDLVMSCSYSYSSL